jgi:hypothetical protein
VGRECCQSYGYPHCSKEEGSEWGIRWIHQSGTLDLRLDPTVLSNWIIHLVFVVAVTHGIAAHVSAELERVVAILEFVLKKQYNMKAGSGEYQ